MHHWRMMQLVEGEKEGGEVGKVVKSHGGGQPAGGENRLTNIFKFLFTSQPVMGAVQVGESREEC